MFAVLGVLPLFEGMWPEDMPLMCYSSRVYWLDIFAFEVLWIRFRWCYVL